MNIKTDESVRYTIRVTETREKKVIESAYIKNKHLEEADRKKDTGPDEYISVKSIVPKQVDTTVLKFVTDKLDMHGLMTYLSSLTMVYK